MPATTRRRGDAAGPPVPPPSRYWPEPVLVPGAAAVYRNAYQFGWPAVPETAHDGHTVTVIRQLTAAECDDENQPMYEVTCTGTGGTPFHVFAEELENPALTADLDAAEDVTSRAETVVTEWGVRWPGLRGGIHDCGDDEDTARSLSAHREHVGIGGALVRRIVTYGPRIVTYGPWEAAG